tara:strand:- start:3555 stop:6200 length:2646 start_codon:yes stop_codon:yes gene_type:complete
MATISIADNDARVQYTQAVTADSTQLTIDFPFFSLDDINVIVTSTSGTDTTLTRGSGTGTFTVNGTAVDDGFSGGNVTLGDTYASGTKYTIFRDIAVSRTTDFPTSGPFNISSLNTELDRIIAIEQELETAITRTLSLPESDTTTALVLPNVDNRKGKTLAFNASSGAVESGPTISGITTVNAMAADIAALADIEDGTTATDAISGLAAIKANVTTAAGIASNITTVAGIQANVTTVAGVQANVTTVAGIASDVTSVAGISSAVSSVNSNSSNINTVAGAISNVNTVGGIASSVTTVAGVASNVTAVAGISSDVTTLANALSSSTTFVVTVANVGGVNVFVVDGSNKPSLQLDRGNTYIFDQSDASNSGHPLAFKNGSSSYTTGVTSTGTPGSSGAKTTIIVDSNAPSSGLLYYCTVHGNAMGNSITTVTNNFSVVASNIGNINSVAGNSTNINSVASSIANVNTVAGTLTAVNSFNDLFSAGSSAPSSPSEGDLWYDTTNSALKVYVSGSFQLAGAYLQGLTTTHVFTATSNQTTFTTDDASQTMSIFANGNTLVFKNGIRLVEGSNGSTNDYHISGNNVVLNAGATAGDILYVEVFTKVSTTQETSLNSLVTTAQGHANTASTQAATATTQATAATTAKTAAETAKTASETAKTASETAKTASEAAQAAAEAALDSFDDRYLGAKSSAPSTDNDGNALLTGSLYFNSTSNKLNVWDGSAWQQGAFSAGSLMANVVEDTTPVLGGSLDVGTNSIVSVSNRDINITPNGSGSVVLDGLNYPQADGSAGQFLKTDGSGQLSFGTVSTPSLSSLGIANHDNLSVDGSGNVALGSSSIAFGTSKWTIVLDGTDLDFQYNGSTVFKLGSNGAVTSADNITAYGSP